MTATPAQISARELRARTPHEGKNGGHQKTRGFSHARLLIHAAGREHGPAKSHRSASIVALRQRHRPRFCQARSSATETASFAGFRFERRPLGLIERRFFWKIEQKASPRSQFGNITLSGRGPCVSVLARYPRVGGRHFRDATLRRREVENSPPAPRPAP